METEAVKAEEVKPFHVNPPFNYAGAFSVIQPENKLYWHTCRETFANSFKRAADRIVFSHKPNATENIQAFFSKVENMLKLKRNRTKIMKTDRPNVSYIEVPEWWRKYRVRRSLFTVFLRSAQNYNIKKDNFENALFSDHYAKETQAAVLVFLEGNTFCKVSGMSGNAGWRDSFRNKSAKSIRDILTKPPMKPVVEVNEVNESHEDAEQEDHEDNESA